MHHCSGPEWHAYTVHWTAAIVQMSCRENQQMISHLQSRINSMACRHTSCVLPLCCPRWLLDCRCLNRSNRQVRRLPREIYHAHAVRVSEHASCTSMTDVGQTQRRQISALRLFTAHLRESGLGGQRVPADAASTLPMLASQLYQRLHEDRGCADSLRRALYRTVPAGPPVSKRTCFCTLPQQQCTV